MREKHVPKFISAPKVEDLKATNRLVQTPLEAVDALFGEVGLLVASCDCSIPWYTVKDQGQSEMASWKRKGHFNGKSLANTEHFPSGHVSCGVFLDKSLTSSIFGQIKVSRDSSRYSTP